MRYLFLFLLSVIVYGCGTTQGSNNSKTLNTSNLQRTNHGTLKLVPIASKTEEQNKVSKGIPYNPLPNQVKEVDVLPKVFLPPKQAQLKAESSLSKDGPKIEPLILTPATQVEAVQEKGPSISINWSGLIMYYLLAAWVAALTYIFYKNFFKPTEVNPFKEKKKTVKKKSTKR